jgi:hypothetical protein
MSIKCINQEGGGGTEEESSDKHEQIWKAQKL